MFYASHGGACMARMSRRAILGGIYTLIALLGLSQTSAPAELIINEIYFNAPEPWPPTQEFPTPNPATFVEIYNPGTNAVALAGYRFDQGITFTFPTNAILPSQGFAVVCEHIPTFTNTYPTVNSLIGQFSGSLAKGGERITLSRQVDGVWTTVDTLDYIDDDAADGTGRSLELIHPGFSALAEQYYGDWAASSTLGGTPGTTNSVFQAAPPAVVGDVLHSPSVPPAGASIQVTARVATSHAGAPATVLANFRNDSAGAAWANTPMRDDGLFPDTVADDGLYTVMLPSYGYPPMAEGQIMEFKISVTDNAQTRTFPATNRTGNLPTSDALSYLCFFGTDSHADEAFPGEYPTYRFLLTAANLAALHVGANNSPSTVRARDATMIAPNGKIFYNGSTKGRGSGSSTTFPYNYRFDLPKPDTYDDLSYITLNHVNARQQHFGSRIMQLLGHNVIAPESELSRLWLNNQPKHDAASERLYNRIESINRGFLEKHYPTMDGNAYAVSDGFSGTLSMADLPVVTTRYDINLYNPYWAWKDLTNLIVTINGPTAGLPTTLPSVLDPGQWARLFAAMVVLDNGEVGFYSPKGNTGDEMRLFLNPQRKADVLPWDFDTLIGSGARLWGWTLPALINILYAEPTLVNYMGDAIDIAENVMSDANLNLIFDSMGSKQTSNRASWLATIQLQRNNLRNLLNHRLTVTGLDDATFSMVGLATNLVGSNLVYNLQLAGTAPQTYTAEVRVNGNRAQYTPRPVGAWTMTNAIPFTAGLHSLTLETRNTGGALLRQRNIVLLVSDPVSSQGGTLISDVVWSPTQGIFYVASNLTVPNGRTLILQPGAVMTLGPGVQLSVSGDLRLEGTTNAPVSVYPYSGTTPWNITLASGGHVILDHAHTRGGHFIIGAGGTVDIDNSTLEDSTQAGGILSATGATVHITRSVLRRFVKTAFTQTTVTIDESLFENMSLTGMEFSGGSATTRVTRTTVRLDAAASNLVTGIRFSDTANASLSSLAVQNMSGTGIVATASSLLITDSLVNGCDVGIASLGASSVAVTNASIAQTRQALAGTPALTSAILWYNQAIDGGVTATIAYSDVQRPGMTLYPGTANINREPFFVDPGIADFSLQSISSALNMGFAGSDMGAAAPFGAAPASPTNLIIQSASATSVTLAWSDGDARETGFEIERSLDGGIWLPLGTLTENSTSFTDNTVNEGMRVAYRVRAFNPRLPSFYSTVVATTVPLSQSLQDLIDGLRITEIMYNPSMVGSTNHHRDLEFLEFQNIGDQTLDLSGLILESGMFVFTNGTTLAPGGIWLLISNIGGFEARYPTVEYDGVFAPGNNLSNSGEFLGLVDAATNSILYFEYRDTWYPTTDGGGASLVLFDPQGDLSSPFSWMASSQPNGTPGVNIPPAFGTVVINEVLAHTDPPLEDAIEVYNAGTTSVNIAGWYLSDSRSDPMRYKIPTSPAIVLPPAGYYVFYEGTSFNSNTNTGFAISSLGDSVVLSSGDGSQMTGYRTDERIPATENGVSMGRHARSDGKIEFVPLSLRTFGSDSPTDLPDFRTGAGASNAPPRVGPVVINEIMYQPSDSAGELLEFFELMNRSSQPVQLFTTNHVWFFSEGISYTFPSNTTLLAGEIILIAGVPEADLRTAYGLTNMNLRIFGPFAGRLANNGERLTLIRPDEPDRETGIIANFVVDTVNYRDGSPWPAAAAGQGPSLEKISPELYGNEPLNWKAGTIGGSPGRTNSISELPSVAFARVASSALESNETVSVEVILLPAPTSPVTVDFACIGGTAAIDNDFSLPPGSLTFWPYETNKSFSVTLIDDTAAEPDETVLIELRNVSTNALLGGNRIHTLSIVDTDGDSLPAPAIVPPNGGDFTFFAFITILSGVTDGEVFYTLDGTVPTRASLRYIAPFILTHSATVSARVYLGQINASPVSSLLFRERTPAPDAVQPSIPSNFVETVILTSTDDAKQALGGQPDPSGTIIKLGRSNDSYWQGFRFVNINIPRGSTINSAYVQFVAAATNSQPATIWIYANLVDDAPGFPLGSQFLSTRTRTTNMVSWTAGAWTNVDDRTAAQRTADISPILTEVIHRSGWIPGQAIALLVRAQADPMTRSVYAFDNGASSAALLHVEYTPPANTPVQVYLEALVEGSGQIAGGNQFFPLGQPAQVTATANAYNSFRSWHGDTGAGNTNLAVLNLVMDRNRTVTARFEMNLTSNGTPHWWLAITGHDTNDFETAADDDLDLDTMLAGEEFIAGTNPNDPTSRLAAVSIEFLPGATHLLWQSVTTRFYAIYRLTNLTEISLGSLLTNGIPGEASGTNAYTDTTPPSPAFYRIGVSTNR